ncbi:Recombinase A,recombinase A,RecA-superfamily ATPases implicated in signal transduction,protein RecA,recA bacterial DNA recombination protein [Chlamydia poikilotherma]|uniref:Protein RecA n=1 Tax=Chlamydia poikilotherma TaxID=1967783 RepID=A0A3B0Q1R6_9CHLA|nr:recombinase RecA [Chlamydia poikilotherma]SYX09455.1 Recombinase A,recombinase A,RecA-superfamily ATPases implicated in signal transduction,protein RecA,recA bacterial DNA recombination protein [Chlamydia poikilotherma]
MNVPDRKKALEAAIAYIEKQFGSGSIMSLGKHSATHEISTIKTGALSLDLALGIGGVPKGRIVEIFGPESSGKTTLATHIVANAQKMGGIAAYIDAEHALDPSYASLIGANINDLMISQPDCGEDALSIAELLARSGAVDVIVIDSVAALVPKSELEGDIGDVHVGLQARMMSQALRKLTATLARSQTCAVFINQIREKIGVSFGNPETTTGGRALKFYSSIRMDIRRIGAIKGNESFDLGNRIKVKVAKNKLAPPFRTAEFDILFNEGISSAGCILDLAVEHNIVEKKGSWFNYQDRKLGQGREAVREELKKNKKLFDELEKRIFDIISSAKLAVAEEKKEEQTAQPVA